MKDVLGRNLSIGDFVSYVGYGKNIRFAIIVGFVNSFANIYTLWDDQFSHITKGIFENHKYKKQNVIWIDPKGTSYEDGVRHCRKLLGL